MNLDMIMIIFEYQGVPDRMRGTVWRILLNVDLAKQKQQGIYAKMKLLGRKTSPDLHQIDLDVRRTFRRHVMFRERFSPSQKELFTVLVAHSVYNKQVGVNVNWIVLHNIVGSRWATARGCPTWPPYCSCTSTVMKTPSSLWVS